MREHLLIWVLALAVCFLIWATMMRRQPVGDEGLRWEKACADPRTAPYVTPPCDDPRGTGS